MNHKRVLDLVLTPHVAPLSLEPASLLEAHE